MEESGSSGFDGGNWLEGALLRRLVLQVDQHSAQDSRQDDDDAEEI